MASAADTTVSTTAASVPTVLQPYVTSNLSTASALTDPTKTPYYGLGSYFGATGMTPYQPISPLVTQAAQGASNLGVAGQTSQASDIAANNAAAASNVGGNYMNMATDPNAVNAFMSPYTQNVMNQQSNAAIQNYANTLPQLGSAATQVGGLGGSREALMQGQAQQGLQQTLGNIQATGLQNAFNNAQQNMQFGTTAGIQGIGLSNNAASVLGQQGLNATNQATNAINTQNAIGTGITNYGNVVGAANYQDYLNQMNDPLTKAGQMSSFIKNVPIAGSINTTTNPSSTLGNIGGVLGGLGTLINTVGSQP